VNSVASSETAVAAVAAASSARFGKRGPEPVVTGRPDVPFLEPPESAPAKSHITMGGGGAGKRAQPPGLKLRALASSTQAQRNHGSAP